MAGSESLARLDGQPLLSEEGMDAVDELHQAHVAYDEAESMHAPEIQSIDQRISELEAEKNELLGEREQEVSKQHTARHSASGRLEKHVTQPTRKDNPVYAAVIRSIASDGQLKLWYPRAFEAGDEIGQGFVRFSRALKSQRRSQPALIIEREGNDYTNLYMARTKRSTGLKPTTVAIEERRGYNAYTVDREALAIPVNERRILGLQIHPNALLRHDSLSEVAYEHGPGLRENVSDAFKLLLPQGHLFEGARRLGSYDSGDTTVDIQGRVEEGYGGSRLQIAIGQLSITNALGELEEEFKEKSIAPDELQRWFEALGQVALGNVQLAIPPRIRKRVTTNFSPAA